MVVFLVALLALCGAVSLPASFAGQVASILALAANSSNGFDRLSAWVDLVGPRVSGSSALEHALDVALQGMEREGFANVHAEAATIPRWVRGSESLTLLQPYVKPLGLLGLGSSIGGDVTAEVIVVRTFDELDSRVKGKIVLYNYVCDWERSADACYGQMVTYRVDGASHAAKFGAVAALTRSLTGRSLYTPHTGDMEYAAGVPQIPAACITTEDADLFQRLSNRGIPIRVRLQMAAQNFPPVPSRNIVAELRGSDFPEEVVLLGGHTDSWDVGQGAEDDGAGFMVAWEALSLIQRAGIVPRRTLRLIGWVCEEFGGIGAQQVVLCLLVFVVSLLCSQSTLTRTRARLST